jgi:hypothetical protein
MEYSSKNNGWRTFSEHWGFLTVLLVTVLGWQVLSFFTSLSGAPWIWFYGIALSLALFGVCLIFYAKLPLYRERRFVTFGSGALPQSRRSFYRWGYFCAVFAVVLLFCLFLSRQ